MAVAWPSTRRGEAVVRETCHSFLLAQVNYSCMQEKRRAMRVNWEGEVESRVNKRE